MYTILYIGRLPILCGHKKLSTSIRVFLTSSLLPGLYSANRLEDILIARLGVLLFLPYLYTNTSIYYIDNKDKNEMNDDDDNDSNNFFRYNLINRRRINPITNIISLTLVVFHLYTMYYQCYQALEMVFR